ncbi:hypothetical protein J3R82DRAFT_8024 [Butyriboletus roseoflavus]|nr:hypothetical protein J3R82DRAFT_8024 [Butyriboletus roseoflavus]
MSTTPCTPPYNLPCRPALVSLDDRATRSFSTSSSSTVPFPRATSLSPIPPPRRTSTLSSTHAGSESPFEPRPNRGLASPPSRNLYPPLDIDLLALGTLDTPTKPHPHCLTLDLDFDTSWALDVPSSASSTMSYATAATSASSPPQSPAEDDAFRVQNPTVAETSPTPFTFTSILGPDRTGTSSQSTETLRESRGSSTAGSDLTVLLQPRLSVGFAQEGVTSHGFSEQRYLRSAIPTPYYTAHSTPEPELADDGPRAGPSHLPALDTNITVSNILSAHKSSPSPPLSRDSVAGRPPSPAPTADFSMISPPSSPTFDQYNSQLAEDADADPFRSSHIRGTATLPFLRSNSTSVAGSFHFTANGRAQSMNASMGLGPLVGKPRRMRPGISRLWESLASPAKGCIQPSSMPRDAQLTPIPAARAKSSPMPGFSVVRSKTSPMMGVGRKLKEKRRIKRVRRGTLEVDTDVDYGALDPLDGEEGELVGCTCTGWGDGACVCGYGYWDVHDYTQQPECLGEGEGAPKIPTPLTRLPPELFLQVLSYLPLCSILAVSSTCRAWRSLALDNGVWWGLWQAREGVPRVPNHTPSQSSDLGHRTQDSFGGFGRRYRGVKDEGIYGLSMPTTEHEHDGEQWDEPSGWAVSFDRANMRLKETARLRHQGASNRVFIYPDEKRRGQDGQQSDAPSEEGGGDEHEVEKQEATTPSEPQPISRQAPLTLDWHRLYRGRSILEQRWRDPEGEPRVLRIDGHRDSVYCLDFDSSRIISGSRDRTIKVWCIKTGKCVASFEGHTGSVLCLKFERDWDLGSDRVCRGFMVSGSSDCSVCVWDLVSTPVGPGEISRVSYAGGNRPRKWRESYATAVTGSFGPPRKISAEKRKVLRGHSGGVLDLRMDEKWIVSCSKDALMHVYDRKTLTLHTVLRGHEGPVNAVGLENGRVVSASGDGKMMLWDVETGKCIRVFEGHEKGLACIEFKDGLILSGSNDCTIRLWRASTGECLHTFAGHTLLVRALCFDPKTGYIVSTSYDKSVRVWEWHGEAVENSVSQPGVEPPSRKNKGVGRLVREFRNLHASHIFDVKFDVGKIVSTSHDQRIVVLDFSYGIEGAELFA